MEKLKVSFEQLTSGITDVQHMARIRVGVIGIKEECVWLNVCVCARCHSCPRRIKSCSLRQPAVSAQETESVRAGTRGFSMHQMLNERM